MNHYILKVREIEEVVASTIRGNHAQEFRLVDAALDQILRGLEDFAYRKDEPDNALEGARLLLATRSFNSLWIATQILERGYYQQALALVRMAMEDQLIARDAENYPPTLAALLKGKGKLGKKDLALNKMAARLSPEEQKGWESEYGTASVYGTHPRLESIRGLFMLDPDGRRSFGPGGGGYDKVRTDLVMYYLLGEVINVLATITKVAKPIGSDWEVGVIPVYKKMVSLRKELNESAVMALDQNDPKAKGDQVGSD